MFYLKYIKNGFYYLKLMIIINSHLNEFITNIFFIKIKENALSKYINHNIFFFNFRDNY